MKRVDNLYDRICSLSNLQLAHKRAKRGKRKQINIKLFELDKDNNLLKLQKSLLNLDYNTSEYKVFTINDSKERIIYRLPYFPDRIVHHAIMNVLEPIFVNMFIGQTYNCIKKRGIHRALRDVRKSLRDVEGTKYCLKLDISKFYPSIDNTILKALLRKKFKDKRLLILLDNIIDSAKGVPIGNYLSQYFANFYLTYFDHWIKEELKIKNYFRYCDDIVILASTKEELWNNYRAIREYLDKNLNLKIKVNYRVFPTILGIDFVGYKIYPYHTLLRKGIKTKFIRMVKYNYNYRSIVSYKGWLKHCNSINLTKKYLKNE